MTNLNYPQTTPIGAELAEAVGKIVTGLADLHRLRLVIEQATQSGVITDPAIAIPDEPTGNAAATHDVVVRLDERFQAELDAEVSAEDTTRVYLTRLYKGAS